MLNCLIVEDNEKLRLAMKAGLQNTGQIAVIGDCDTGEAAVEHCLDEAPDVILMDVQLAGVMNGIETAVAVRREYPRLPVVFYSIQDDDAYYRAFRQAGILSHYAYVRKSNFLLPQMVLPLLRDAVNGRSYIDPDIESRVQEVRHKDENAPLDLLEPNERQVALMLAQGLSNQQIAQRMGFRDKRTISRVNGQIYAAWDLNRTTADEKVARTRAVIIVNHGRLLTWDEDGTVRAENDHGQWQAWLPPQV